MKNRIWLATITVAAALVLGACGDDTESAQGQDVSTTSEASAPSSSTSAAASSSVAPEPGEALAEGIIVHQCTIGGDLSSNVLSYDPVSGQSSEPVAFQVADTTGNTQSNAYCTGLPTTHEDGQKFRSAFSADFTKYFVEVKEPSTGTSVVGYYSPDGEFTQISTVGDEFTKTDDRYPTFHAESGKLFYWNYVADEPQLMSVVPEPGSIPQPEPALQKMAYYGEDIYTPLTKKPLIADNEDDVAFNDAGTLVADVDGGVKIAVAGDPIKLANDIQAVPFDKEIDFKDGRSVATVGFIDDDSVVFTDGQQIFRADVQGGVAVVTVLHANTNKDTAVANVTIRQDKSSIAFLATSGGQAALYVKPIDGGASEATKVTLFPQGTEARILQFK